MGPTKATVSFSYRMYYVYVFFFFRYDVLYLCCFSFQIGCNMSMLFLFPDRMYYDNAVSLPR